MKSFKQVYASIEACFPIGSSAVLDAWTDDEGKAISIHSVE
ncbi:MAG: hypothetical protein ACJ0FM_04005 [Gammaproteobacteria bacterium]